MSVVIALLGRAGWLDAGVRELCDPSDRLTGWIPACGDLCIIPFLPQQGEVPKAEGVLLRQALSGTHAGRTPLYLRCRPGNKCFPGRSVVR